MSRFLPSSCFTVLRCLCASLLGLALLVGSGLGELGWQGYAWATMLWDRSPEMGLSEALEDTFSGESPCPHCLAVQESFQKKTKEREPLAPHSSETLRLGLPMLGWNAQEKQEPHWTEPAQAGVNFAQAYTLASLWREKPPVPPPRWGA